jgi:hypothetical protein
MIIFLNEKNMSNYSHKDYKNNEYKYYITLSWKYASKYLQYYQIRNDYEKMKNEVYNKYMKNYDKYNEEAMDITYYNLINDKNIIKKKEEVEIIKKEYMIIDNEYYYLYNKFNLSQI